MALIAEKYKHCHRKPKLLEMNKNVKSAEDLKSIINSRNNSKDS